MLAAAWVLTAGTPCCAVRCVTTHATARRLQVFVAELISCMCLVLSSRPTKQQSHTRRQLLLHKQQKVTPLPPKHRPTSPARTHSPHTPDDSTQPLLASKGVQCCAHTPTSLMLLLCFLTTHHTASCHDTLLPHKHSNPHTTWALPTRTQTPHSTATQSCPPLPGHVRYQSPSHSVTLECLVPATISLLKKAQPSQTLGVHNSYAARLRAVTPASTHLSTPTI